MIEAGSRSVRQGMDPSDQPSIAFLAKSDVQLAHHTNQYCQDVCLEEDKSSRSRGDRHSAILLVIPGLRPSPGHDMLF